jgi:hypothetical protein
MNQSENNKQRIVLSGGGTGGSVTPLLAIAESLMEKFPERFEFHWVGTATGIERRMTDSYSFTYHAIAAGKLRRYFSGQNFIDIINIIAGFFRVLYNATFLNAEYSNRALETLTHATFSDGLVAGIPKDVKIAHKFGERIERNSKGELIVELHDCGIIYAPQTPYLLCVMTHGDSLETNATIIKEISSLVYDEVVD